MLHFEKCLLGIISVGLLLMVSAIYSCITDTPKIPPTTVSEVQYEGIDSISTFTYNKHDYIQFHLLRAYSPISIVHNPDCPCHVSKIGQD